MKNWNAMMGKSTYSRWTTISLYMFCSHVNIFWDGLSTVYAQPSEKKHGNRRGELGAALTTRITTSGRLGNKKEINFALLKASEAYRIVRYMQTNGNGDMPREAMNTL